jgi:hypothetical protein
MLLKDSKRSIDVKVQRKVIDQSKDINSNKYFSSWLPPLYRKYRRLLKEYKNQNYIKKCDKISVSKDVFIDNIKNAVEKKQGYAAAKLGVSQKYWMYYKVLIEEGIEKKEIEEFEKKLMFHGLKQVGIFPAAPKFYLEYNEFYMEHVRNIDYLGLFFQEPELELIKFYDLKNKFIYFPLQEPDRSSPENEENCYLKYFKNKKILIICPFANLLKERCSKEIFEAVWSKIGKKWFFPKKVDSLEFPYGFEEETQKAFPTAIDLFAHIKDEIVKKDFDIALIAAAGLSIPIASFVKKIGKIGIDLGGHLQFLFGVTGKRWREREDIRKMYFNESWIDMPKKYHPHKKGVCDNGAYW